jgi:hypothetical protein
LVSCLAWNAIDERPLCSAAPLGESAVRWVPIDSSRRVHGISRLPRDDLHGIQLDDIVHLLTNHICRQETATRLVSAQQTWVEHGMLTSNHDIRQGVWSQASGATRCTDLLCRERAALASPASTSYPARQHRSSRAGSATHLFLERRCVTASLKRTCRTPALQIPGGVRRPPAGTPCCGGSPRRPCG